MEVQVEGEEGGVHSEHGGCEHRGGEDNVQLCPETPGKHSGGISRTSESFILIHALL